MKKIFFLLAGLLIFASVASAHQPRIIGDEEVTRIENPEVSQAFYGELKWNPAIFEIVSQEPFNLYVGITVPALEDIDTDYLVEVFKDDSSPFITLDGKEQEWIKFFEPFGGDDYLRGPEHEMQVEKGKYTIKVSSSDNEGKYVLIVGREEVFTLEEVINTIKTLPVLKEEFFDTSAWLSFFNYTGVFLLFAAFAVMAILILISRALKKLF
jgi:hypothetical protein